MQKTRTFKKLAILTATLAATNLTTFQQFAVAVSQQTWDGFVSETLTTKRAQPQNLIVNTRNQYWQHGQTPHSDTPGAVAHTQTDTAPYNQFSHHVQDNNAGFSIHGPVNYTTEDYSHFHNGTQGGRHHRVHKNLATGRHSQGTWHFDRYTQMNIHSQNNYNQASHSDSPGWSSTPHTDTGFDHRNYVPSAPAFFNLTQDRQILGTFNLRVLSYDRNRDGLESQSWESREVFYNLEIRRIQNLNGTSNISHWRTLLSNVSDWANESAGAQFSLNTIDPLGTGNTNPATTEGVYEIRAVAQNTVHSTNFPSGANIIRVRIQQNHIPEITVQNGSEFINFTFGFNGALNPSNIYRTYQEGLFANTPTHQQEGIFVRISMRDRDTLAQSVQNWQRGRIFLSNSSNVEIAGTSVPIVWENGLQIISSENIAREGIGFIPRNSFTGLGDLVGARVTVEVSDFRNAEATTPTGTTVTQRTISTADTTTLTVNVDVTAPTVTATSTTTTWRNTPPSVTLNYTDTLSGVHLREFAITDSVITPTTGWLPYTVPVTINTDGERFLHFRGTDRLRNVRTGVFGPYRLDRVAPTGSITEAILGANEVRLTATATDALSGINEIRATGPAGSGGPWVSTTSPLIFTATREGNYTFTIRDNAGNIHTITHNVIFVPILHGLSLTHIVRPPAGTVAPISYPVPQPTRVNSGFRMTFRVNAQRASSVELRLFANGVPVNIHTDAGSSQFLARNTTTLDNTSVEFAFWVDRNIPLNTVLDMRLILRRDGHVITNNDIGRRFAIISGSARQSIGINLTR